MVDQPSLDIDVQSVPALSTKTIGNDAVDSYTDTQCYWEVVCEMAVQCAYLTHRPLASFANCKLNEHIANSNFATPNTAYSTLYSSYPSNVQHE